jgi:hypothetical protein
MQLSFWTFSLVPSEFSGWTTYAVTLNLSACVEARASTPYATCLFDLHWKLFGGGPICNTSHGTQSTIRLKPDLAGTWATLKRVYELDHMVANGTVQGFFMGDEMAYNGLPLVELEEAAATVRSSYPGTWIYANEARRPLDLDVDKCGRTLGYEVPPSLDALSIDTYDAGLEIPGFVSKVRHIYEEKIFPKLRANQSAWLMPGAFASASASGSKCKGNLTCWDDMCAREATDWAAWAHTDKRVTGMYGWHWQTRSASHLPNKEIGLEDMPRCRMAWRQIGTKLVPPHKPETSPPLISRKETSGTLVARVRLSDE